MMLLIDCQRVGEKRNFKHEFSPFYNQLRTMLFWFFVFFGPLHFRRVIIVHNVKGKDLSFLLQTCSKLFSSMCIGIDGDALSPGCPEMVQNGSQHSWGFAILERNF